MIVLLLFGQRILMFFVTAAIQFQTCMKQELSTSERSILHASKKFHKLFLYANVPASIQKKGDVVFQEMDDEGRRPSMAGNKHIVG